MNVLFIYEKLRLGAAYYWVNALLTTLHTTMSKQHSVGIIRFRITFKDSAFCNLSSNCPGMILISKGT